MTGNILNTATQIATIWTVIGLVGAVMFTSRWFVQFLHSRTKGVSSVPPLFWVMSALGSVATLAYFIFGNPDLIGIISNLFPLFVSVYNLILISRQKDKVE